MITKALEHGTLSAAQVSSLRVSPADGRSLPCAAKALLFSVSETLRAGKAKGSRRQDQYYPAADTNVGRPPRQTEKGRPPRSDNAPSRAARSVPLPSRTQVGFITTGKKVCLLR